MPIGIIIQGFRFWGCNLYVRISLIQVKIILILFVIVFILPASIQASQPTQVNLLQITSDGSQQKDAFIHKDLVAYTNFGGSQGIDIWGYDLSNQVNYPLIERLGQQFITGLNGNFIVYEDVDNTSNYNVRLFNIKNGKDILIAGGTGSQTSGVTNGKYVVYIDGGACGSIHAYNLKKKTDTIISPQGCQPLRISDNIVLWPNGAPGGTNIYGYDFNKETPLDVVIEDNFQESPNIFENKVVWLHYITGSLGDYNAIKMKDLKTGQQKTIYESTTSTLQWPAISNRYVVWSESSAQHVNGIKAANLKTGEVFEVQPQGPHQNSHTMPSIWKNIASWMSFRTGNGDIYTA